MSGMDVSLLRPYWLLSLLPFAGFAYWSWHRPRGIGDWHKAADPALMQAMRALGRVYTQSSRAPLMVSLSLIFVAILALSGPAIERRDTLSFRNLDGVLFLVDASSSVTEDPGWTQLLTAGRFALSGLGTRPGGLIVFAGDAYVATNMTADHLQLGQTLSLIDSETIPDKGSRPERALQLAAQMLEQAEVIAGDVVMLTDGDGLGPESLQAATQIAARGARLSLLSMREPGPAFQTHATAGGGTVFTTEETEELVGWLQEDARQRLAQQDFPLLFWTDFGRCLLALALIPALLMFRRSPA